MMKDIRGKGGMIEKSDPLVPIEFELEIDGVGAIYPGNAFQSSYLPEKYRKIACFQVVGLNQKLDSSGWTSTIKGQIRVSIKSSWPDKDDDDDDGKLIDLEIVPGPRPLPGPLPVTIEVTITEIEEDITEPDPEPTPEPTPEPKRDIDTITTIELAQQQILRLDDDEEVLSR